jgi:protein SCO1
MASERNHGNRGSEQRRNVRATAFALAGIAALMVALFVRQFLSPAHLDPEWLRAQGAVLFDPPRAFDAPVLRDQNDQSFDGSAFASNWSVVFFGFTYCPDVCPTTLALLRQVELELQPSAGARRPVRFFMVSVDPARDTPAQLKTYVAHFSPNLTGLTGEFIDVHRFATQLSVPFRKVVAEDGSYSVDHGANLALINPQGHFAGMIMPPLDKARLLRLLELLRSREG